MWDICWVCWRSSYVWKGMSFVTLNMSNLHTFNPIASRRVFRMIIFEDQNTTNAKHLIIYYRVNLIQCRSLLSIKHIFLYNNIHTYIYLKLYCTLKWKKKKYYNLKQKCKGGLITNCDLLQTNNNLLKLVI